MDLVFEVGEVVLVEVEGEEKGFGYGVELGVRK